MLNYFSYYHIACSCIAIDAFSSPSNPVPSVLLLDLPAAGVGGAPSVRVLVLGQTHPLPVYTHKVLLGEDPPAWVLIAPGAFQTQGDIREWRRPHAHKSPRVALFLCTKKVCQILF